MASHLNTNSGLLKHKLLENTNYLRSIIAKVRYRQSLIIANVRVMVGSVLGLVLVLRLELGLGFGYSGPWL